MDTETGDSDWSADVDRHVGTPAVADNRIFAAGPERAYGLSTTDGSEHWQYAHEANRGTIPAYADGTVYLGLAAPGTGTSRNGLLALDATDGTERWQTETEGVVVAPAVVDGTVYAATLDGSVLALDAATGESAWLTAPAGRLPQSPGSPSVAHGRVYVRTDSAIYALDTASGEVVWDHSTGKSVVHPPVVVGNQLAVASGGTVSMYDAADGETQYELAVGSERWITGVTITDGTAYLGSSKSGTLTIHALA